jgi:histone deacetylase complex regulatory component SIN3
MTFPKVSAHDNDAVSAISQSFNHQVRMYHPGTHYPDSPHIGRVLQARNPGQVTASIRAPVAKEPDYDRFEIVRHDHILLEVYANSMAV